MAYHHYQLYPGNFYPKCPLAVAARNVKYRTHIHGVQPAVMLHHHPSSSDNPYMAPGVVPGMYNGPEW